MIQTYTFAGTGRQIDAQGVFFRYETGSDGSGVTSIRVLADGAILGTFEPGDTIDLPTPAKRWEIYPTSTGCIGSVRVGNARVSSNKLQGLVQTIDGGKARSIAGAAMIGYVTAPQVASQYSQAEIWNKSTTKNLIVPSVSVATTASNTLFLTFETVQLATLFAAGKCKRLGSFTADGELRRSSTVTQPNPATALKGWVIPAGYVEYRSSEPFVVRPGEGLRLSSYVQNVDFGVTFEWFEEPI